MTPTEAYLTETIIHAEDLKKRSIFSSVQEVFQYRLLLYVFLMRDIKVRYTQTILGFLWIVLAPLITVGVFTFVFGMMIKIPTNGLPYLLFYLVAIIPWYAFIAMLNHTVSSVEGNAG